MTVTVIDHVLSRLRTIGITDVFGVPGDYSFSVNDAICHHPEIRWIGCTNELNAGYAADGYARIKGVGAVCTTYGVGELSAINAIAGSYAEHLPVFHLVGTPPASTQAARALMHHTLGNGEYGLFQRMSEAVVVASAVMTPQNAAYETERLIREALYHRRPVYMAFPADLANLPLVAEAAPLPLPKSVPANLARAADAILDRLATANSACILAGMLVGRTGDTAALEKLLAASGLPLATMFMGKSVLDEQHPAYIGIYDGALLNEEVRAFVETADLVLDVGAPMTDFNTGAFTAKLDPEKTISIVHHHVRIDGKVLPGVEIGDILEVLAQRVGHRDWPRLAPTSLGPVVGEADAPIDAASLYPRWANFIRPGDILVAETGTASMGLGFALLPEGASFHNQTLWGSIGWATPAAVGAAAAAPDRRVVLVTGDGSHQLTVQELGQFARLGLKPVVFVLNNNGYLIERLLCKEPEIAYNDIAQWRYTELPHAFGCDGWLTARVTTNAELDAAMDAAETAQSGVYIEVVTDTYAASPLSLKLHEAVQTLYK
ncbi:alpha-keto acid decarboxylase family protein [Xanthobacter sediminis]